MKYVDMPLGHVADICKIIQKQSDNCLGIEPAKAKEITKAKRKYKEIIARIPEFEKKGQIKMNLITVPCFPSISAYNAYTSRCRCSNRIL